MFIDWSSWNKRHLECRHLLGGFTILTPETRIEMYGVILHCNVSVRVLAQCLLPGVLGTRVYTLMAS